MISEKAGKKKVTEGKRYGRGEGKKKGGYQNSGQIKRRTEREKKRNWKSAGPGEKPYADPVVEGRHYLDTANTTEPPTHREKKER